MYKLSDAHFNACCFACLCPPVRRLYDEEFLPAVHELKPKLNELMTSPPDACEKVCKLHDSKWLLFCGK